MFKSTTKSDVNTKSSNSALFQKEKGTDHFFQAKLNVGEPEDKHEVETDVIVARGQDRSSQKPFLLPIIQQQPESELKKQKGTEEIQEKQLAGSISPVIQLDSQNEGEESKEGCITCQKKDSCAGCQLKINVQKKSEEGFIKKEEEEER
jgi:hypothetical protein